MSTFAIEKLKIASVLPHPNADRLDIVKVSGLSFQFVSQKGTQVEGNEAVYFPVDSIFPDELSSYFDIKKMLVGKNHDRLRTVKLRGEYSQGLVLAVDRICEYLSTKGHNFTPETLPVNVTELLNVTKYEPPEVFEKNARLIPLNGLIESYDIEGSQRFPHIINYMMDKKVMISEKLEGMNGGVSYFSNGETKVNQRNFFIEPKDGVEHTFWKVSNKYNLTQICKELSETRFNNKSVTIRFEVLGGSIQGNYYELKEHDLRAFDIKVDGKYLDVNEFLEICDKYRIPTVPILAKDVTLKEWLNGKTFEEASNGKSVLIDKLREGIVCKLMEEQSIEGYGRSIIKMRSMEYLAGNDL